MSAEMCFLPRACRGKKRIANDFAAVAAKFREAFRGGLSVKIEKLEPSQHKQGRWLVWLEDGCLVRVEEGDVVSLGLYTGKELTQAESEALAAAEKRGQMDRRAVALLTARPMSRKELEDKLSTPVRRRKKPGREEIQPAPEALERERERLAEDARRTAERMEGLGLLNDQEYAKTVARHYAAKGYGPRKLREELYRRGVPREFWEDALAQWEARPDQLDELVSRRLRGAEPTQENLKKTSDYLARRGFSWEEISAALERYKDQWQE